MDAAVLRLSGPGRGGEAWNSLVKKCGKAVVFASATQLIGEADDGDKNPHSGESSQKLAEATGTNRQRLKKRLDTSLASVFL